jgi:hypothetical protein
MGQADYPICIHCDSYSRWFISREGEQTVYHCGGCGNTVVVATSDD